MPKRILTWVLLVGTLLGCVSMAAGANTRESEEAPVSTLAVEDGFDVTNPLFDGWYADPEIHRYDGVYWIFPTKSLNGDFQDNLDCFSSPDLKNWTKHENILDMSTFVGARRQVWAPTQVERDGKHYLLFGANAIHNDGEDGGFYMGVADTPEGPYVNVNADGSELLNVFHNRAQPIDAHLYKDDDPDETMYIYYGGEGVCNVGIMNDTMDGFIPVDNPGPTSDIFQQLNVDGNMSGYVEGPFMIKRDDVYYLMYSTGLWSGDNYGLIYATGDNPFGPFETQDKILENNPKTARSAGHHSAIYVEEEDQWLVCYHRRDTRDADGNHRMVCLDKLNFDDEGKIIPIAPTYGWSWDGTTSPVENLARIPGATYSSSSVGIESGRGAEMAFDGKLGDNSRWAATNGGPDAWLQVDFGSPQTFNQILLYYQTMGNFGGLQGRVRFDISDDGVDWETITPTRPWTAEEQVNLRSVYAYGFDLYEINEFYAEPVEARYLRVYFEADVLWNSIYEFEVYYGADKTELREAIETAKATYTDSALSRYKSDGVAAYQEALAGAEKVLSQPANTQMEADIALRALRDAIDALELRAGTVDYTFSNPVFPGRYADPEIHLYGDTYWIFPTTDLAYFFQTNLDCFSSTDLVNWTKHENILDMSTYNNIDGAVWAPTQVEKDGKYYLLFGANDYGGWIKDYGGFYMGVADSPEGPYVNVNADGSPILAEFDNGAQPIDAHLYKDDDPDETMYIYYGGWEICNVGIMNDTMDGFIPLESAGPESDTFMQLDLTNYTEGPFMVKRDGVYYLMYSKGAWGNASYGVCYATGDNPLGPFTYEGQILETDLTVAKGPGHHSVVYVPEQDQWLICYHRRTVLDPDGGRFTCIDKMYFDEDGKILPIRMTNEWNWVEANEWNIVNLAQQGNAPEGTEYFATSIEAESRTPDKAFDGIVASDSRWAKSGNSAGQYLGIHFGEPVTLNEVLLQFESGGANMEVQFKFQTSENGETWTDISPALGLSEVERQNVNEGGYQLYITRVRFDEVVETEYLRIYFLNSVNYASLYEFEVYYFMDKTELLDAYYSFMSGRSMMELTEEERAVIDDVLNALRDYGAPAEEVAESLAALEALTGGGSSGSNGGGWAVTSHTVTFHMNHEEAARDVYLTRQVPAGNKAAKPADPELEGLLFDGWYTEAACETLYDFSDAIRGDLHLYAGWIEETPNLQQVWPAYISGYPDGTFGPDRNMSRAEAAKILYTLLEEPDPGEAVFSDVDPDAWYADAVSALADREIINGYPDGTFNPDGEISRAEFVAMAMRFLEVEIGEAEHTFTDVPARHWAVDLIAAAAEAEYVSGYPDGTFRPDASITRAEVVKIVNAMTERPAGEALENPFSDIDDHWAYREILIAANDLAEG